MNTPASLLDSPTKPTSACVRCSERKVRCDKKIPCDTCVRHSVQCIFRAPKQSRKRRELAKFKSENERLKRYEALLRENGIDPNKVIDAEAGYHQDMNPAQSSPSLPETTSTLQKTIQIAKPTQYGKGCEESGDK